MVITGGAIIISVILAFALWAGKKDAEQWAIYREANHCREAGYIDGHTSIGTGVTANGKIGTVTTYTPRKTRWLCDNNVEIFR